MSTLLRRAGGPLSECGFRVRHVVGEGRRGPRTAGRGRRICGDAGCRGEPEDTETSGTLAVLRLHRPGRPVAVYDLTARVVKAPTGAFHIDRSLLEAEEAEQVAAGTDGVGEVPAALAALLWAVPGTGRGAVPHPRDPVDLDGHRAVPRKATPVALSAAGVALSGSVPPPRFRGGAGGQSPVHSAARTTRWAVRVAAVAPQAARFSRSTTAMATRTAESGAPGPVVGAMTWRTCVQSAAPSR